MKFNISLALQKLKKKKNWKKKEMCSQKSVCNLPSTCFRLPRSFAFSLSQRSLVADLTSPLTMSCLGNSSYFSSYWPRIEILGTMQPNSEDTRVSACLKPQNCAWTACIFQSCWADPHCGTGRCPYQKDWDRHQALNLRGDVIIIIVMMKISEGQHIVP